MTRRAHPAIALAFAAITGCSVRGTDITPVEPIAPTAFEGAADPALGSAQPIDAWWTTFQDVRITALVEQALHRSPDVRQATALLRLARARLREREGANWPLGGGRAVLEHRRTQAGVHPALPTSTCSMPVSTRAGEVDLFGARRASITAARADYVQERSLRRLTLVSVAAEVVLAYADVRGTQARLAVARENVANQESASELTQQLLTAGRGTQLDVDRAVALLEFTRASIPPLVAAESSAILYRLGEPSALSRRRWRPICESRRHSRHRRTVLAVGEPVTLLRRRPDVAAAESAVPAAAARAGVAAADLLPRLGTDRRIRAAILRRWRRRQSWLSVWCRTRRHAALSRVEPYSSENPRRRCDGRDRARRLRANGIVSPRGS